MSSILSLAWNKRYAKSAFRLRPLLTIEVLEDRCLLSGGYVQTNLVSDVPGLARFTDPNLTNPWGVSFAPGGPLWISDNADGLSTIYNAAGQDVPLVVQFPQSISGLFNVAGTPTGTVFNPGWGFAISEQNRSGPGQFLFATENGMIAGWNPLVDSQHALVAVDESAAGAVYKGLALGSDPSGTFLFVADFANATIDVFDQRFTPIHAAGAFSDPNLPAGFAPFNIQNIGGKLFVAYALRETDGTDEVYGAGQGVVDVFSTDGQFVQRLVSGGSLNAPWGMAVAPADFGAFSNDLLIGNVGDGRINAFNPNTGAWLGQLQDARGNPVTLPSVWGLTFGGGGDSGSPSTLFFTAGLQDEQHGVFGNLQAVGNVDNPSSSDGQAGTYFREANDSTAEDAYPLPPTTTPILRTASEGQPPELPLLLPFKTLQSGLTNPATVAAFTPSANGNDLLQPGPLSTRSSSVAATAALPSGETGLAAIQPRALEMFLLLSEPLQSDGIVAAAGQIPRFHESSTPPIADNASAPGAGTVSEGELSTAALEPAISVPGPVSAGVESDTRPHAAEQIPEHGEAVSFWFTLPLALGVYFAWFGKPSAARRRFDDASNQLRSSQ